MSETWGGQITEKALIALVVFLALAAVYITVRYERYMAIAALATLVFDLVVRLASEGRTLLVVEQNARRMLGVADRAYVMRSGEIVATGTGADLLARDDLFDTFVGPAT